MSRRPNRLPVLVLLAALHAAACTSTSYQRVVSVNPPDASLYINGVKVGKGDRRPREFDFAMVGRVCIQAVHPNYKPEVEWLTEADMRNLVDTNTDLKITLSPR
ncbi:MAG: hypothetical protein ACK53T_07005 [Planctomycetota bacterium]|jgi:hypothetical protein